MALHDPMRRTERLIEESAGDDVVIYDRDSDRVTALDAADAKVWRNSDGTKSVADLALLADLSESEAAASLVRLDEAGLMAETGMSRRSMLTKAGMVAGGVGAMSLVSIVAPVAAHASSITPPASSGVVAVGSGNPIINVKGGSAAIGTGGVLVVPPTVGTGFPGNTDIDLTYTVALPGGKTVSVPATVRSNDDGTWELAGVTILNSTLGTALTITVNNVGMNVAPYTVPLLSNVNTVIGNVGTNVGKLLGG